MLYGVVYSIYNEESMDDNMRIWQSIVLTGKMLFLACLFVVVVVVVVFWVFFLNCEM